jgi:monoamine oxidase
MSKFAKTPFLKRIVKNYKQALGAHKQELSSTNVEGRRDFIKKAGLVGLGVAFYATLESCQQAAEKAGNELKVTIIGGGIAGLHAGYIFQKSKIPFELYEATARAGGRIYSQKGLLGADLVTELGGEFIDSNHEDMLNLCKEFGLELLDCEKDAIDNKLKKDSYHFGGKFISEEDVIKEFKKYVDKIAVDQGYYENEDEKEMTRLDNLSIIEYIDQIGIKGWFKDFLNAAFSSEFGIEASKQSSLNMLCMLSVDTEDGFKVFGESDERYKIKGGNQALIDKISDKLKDEIKYNHELVAIRKVKDKYEMEFKDGTKTSSEFVLISIPFTALRNVKFEFDLPAEKKQVIDELGYGTNGKVFLGFKSRQWREQGYAGYLFNETIQNGWDNSQMQNNNTGECGYTVFIGGDQGAKVDSSNVPQYLEVLNKVFDKLEYNQKSSVFNWTKNPFARGSYSCFLKGQWMTISGNEYTAVDKIHFAGEHCSEDFQGYMNGGAETGRRAAADIISLLKNSNNTNTKK